METFFHILLHSLKDTAKLIPVFLIVYLLIEFLEYKNIFAFEKSKLLKGKVSPVMGSLFGSVPQCGFSVISSELYSKQKISIGALVAVFVATSDEAFPIMIAHYEAIPALIVLILTKIILGILIGYIAMFLYSKIFKTSSIKIEDLKSHEHAETHDNHDDHEEHEQHIHACCNHDLEDNKFDWKHPIIHCIKISLYIFIFNLIFGSFVEIIGEDNLTTFLASSSIFQPLFAILIGLIPNCASSVVLTELYLMNGLSFGAIVAGLSVNAGLGFIVLLKENRKKKENWFILLTITISSLIFGYILHFLPINLI